jgi:hypothetical protein
LFGLAPIGARPKALFFFLGRGKIPNPYLTPTFTLRVLVFFVGAFAFALAKVGGESPYPNKKNQRKGKKKKSSQFALQPK